MTVQKQIKEYIAAQPEPKRNEMQELHGIILALMPACKLWFLDGKDEKGKNRFQPKHWIWIPNYLICQWKNQGVLSNRCQC
jgi:hypothetical protein